MLYINENVYYVRGNSKGCIYDLNNLKLYHVTNNVIDLIEKVQSKTEDFDDNETLALNTLIENNILTKNFTSNTGCFTTDIKPELSFAWIEICNYCNMRCRHCYNESSQICNSYMSYTNFEYVCTELITNGVKRIQIIGGEPFCHNDIVKMITHAAPLFDSVEIFTNGTLLTSEICTLLKEHNIKIALSIYSYDSNEHDKVTTIKGSHKSTNDAIALLKEFGIKYRVATVHMKNISIGEKNTDLYTINPFKDVVRLSGRGNINLLTPELLKRKLITKNTFSGPVDSKRILNNTSYHKCFGTKLYITATLEVYPCVMERRISHGNMEKHSLKEILNKELQCLTKDNINECKECEFRYACYDCRPDCVDGDIFSKPYYCTYSPSDGKWLDADIFINDFLNKNK